MGDAALPEHRTGVTMVGIPALNEAATIGSVAITADAGLRATFPDGRNLIVLADNGSADGTLDAFRTVPVRTPRLVLEADPAGSGKGTNVLALVTAALEHKADRLILLDADVRSGEPMWIARLAGPLDSSTPTLVIPTYRRDRYEAAVTNHLARPLVAGLFGRDVQQPIAGEFALNAPLLRRVQTWPCPDSARLYGIDIWLTTNTLREGYRVVEVELGRKVHNSPIFAKLFYLPQQVIDALLHVAVRSDLARSVDGETMTASAWRRSAVDQVARCKDPVLIEQLTSTVADYLGVFGSDVQQMFPTLRELVRAPWGFRIDTTAWPEVLADGLAAVATGHRLAVRDHLIALYVNRMLSFWDEVAQHSSAEVDALLNRQAGDTAKAVADRALVFNEREPATWFGRGLWHGFV